MKPLSVTFLVAVLCVGITAAQNQTPAGTTGIRPAPSAGANLVDTEGRSVGQALLQQTPHGVIVKLDLKNATPGVHGLHIHDGGRCDSPSFESAGSHFNPTNRQHGFMNPQGPHAGDLPNIEVPSSTQHSVEYFLPGITLDAGPRTLMDVNGSSIVIHSGKDDYLAEPAGESGDRLACGAIILAETK